MIHRVSIPLIARRSEFCRYFYTRSTSDSESLVWTDTIQVGHSLFSKALDSLFPQDLPEGKSQEFTLELVLIDEKEDGTDEEIEESDI